MGLSEPEVLTFEPDEPGPVLARMRELVEEPGGWVNLEPEVPEEHVPDAPSGLSRLFGGRGPAIPLCTWTPPEPGRGGTEPMTLGVQHGLGSRARGRLEELGLGIPAGWVVRGDHARRGLVIEVPADADLAGVLDWLLAAGEAVATVPVTGRWLAAVHPPA